MVGVAFDVSTVAMNTGTGNQTITGTLNGKTPKAAMFLVSRADTLGTPANGAMISVGFTDGTNSRCSGCMSEDAATVATFDTGRTASTTLVIQTLQPSGLTVEAEAAFSSFSANNVTINITTAPPSGYRLTVIMFYGDTLQATVGDLTASASINGTASVTGLSFQPALVFGLAAIGGFITAAQSRFSFGFAASSLGTITQAGSAFYDRDTPSIQTAVAEALRDDSFLSRFSLTDAGVLTDEGWYELTSFTPDGFTVTTRSVANSIVFGWLALYLGTSRAKAVVYGNPDLDTSAAGTQSIDGAGFSPQAVFAIGTSVNSANRNAIQVDTQAIHVSLGFSCLIGGTSTISDGCIAYQSEDNNSTSDTRSGADQRLVEVLDDAAGFEWHALADSFDSDGFTIDITDATAGSVFRLAAFLFIERDKGDLSWLDARSGHRWRRCLARR